MLRSFEYYDRAPTEQNMPKPLECMVCLLESRAILHDKHRHCVYECPYCGSEDLSVSLNICGIKYYACRSCGALVSDTTAEEYGNYDNDAEIMGMLLSDEYQRSVEEYMSVIWDEFCEWITIRSYRHTGGRRDLRIADIADRFEGLGRRITSMSVCSSYVATDGPEGIVASDADLVVCVDLLQRVKDPRALIESISASMKSGALLVLRLRLATSFDILALGSDAKVIPYENGTLPSDESIRILLERSGMTPLDFTTTGESDLWWVREDHDRIDCNDRFIKHLLNNADDQTLCEFQYFLQKSGYGRNASIIARKD